MGYGTPAISNTGHQVTSIGSFYGHRSPYTLRAYNPEHQLSQHETQLGVICVGRGVETLIQSNASVRAEVG